MDFLMNLQRWIYGGITDQLSGYAGSRDLLGVIAILPLGIMFGAVHALTPGHGKTILASYLVGSRSVVNVARPRRAGVLAFTRCGISCAIGSACRAVGDPKPSAVSAARRRWSL